MRCSRAVVSIAFGVVVVGVASPVTASALMLRDDSAVGADVAGIGDCPVSLFALRETFITS